jgi:hypothetical protein
MSSKNLITYDTQQYLHNTFRSEITLAIKEYVKLQLDNEDCDRIKLYFKKTKIQEDIETRLNLTLSLLTIGDVDTLISSVESKVNIKDRIVELNDYYDELIETQGLEVLIWNFSL